MTTDVAMVQLSMELYHDNESNHWGFSGEVRYGDGKRTGIVGGSDTQREALAFTLDSLREDGLLPPDSVERPAAAMS